MADHAMPKGIRREAKGAYVTLDGAHRIVQEGKVWKLVELVGDGQVGIGEFRSRGDAVRKLATDGKLPAEAPKPEAKQEADQPGPTTAPNAKRRSRAKAAA